MIFLATLYHKWQQRHKAHVIRNTYYKLYKSIFERHPELNAPIQSEREWLQKWQIYDKKISVASYRIFSKFIGEELNIIPLEVCATIVEPELNPQEYINFFADKNSLQLFLPLSFMPKVILRNINGIYYTSDYEAIHKPIDDLWADIDCEKLILKPTQECSGRGVQLITKSKGIYETTKGETVNAAYLHSHYKKDFLIQECVKQNAYMAQFNPTSVNTIRLFTYRNKCGDVIAMKSILRIGGKGANVDNAHSGEMFCGISDNGHLGKFCCSWLGDRATTFNGIDFAKKEFYIPYYEQVKAFGIEIAKRIPYHDLVALDIAINDQNKPTLLEINVGGFSAWLFQFTVGSAFGDFTEEIMQRCKR